MSFKDNFPNATKKELHALEAAKTSIQNALKVSQQNLEFDALKLNSSGRHKLAEAITEFVYDLQNGIGIWQTFELLNREFFGTPLPFVLAKNQKLKAPLINQYRLHYFLWYKYEFLKSDLLISPEHADLEILAKELMLFINQHVRLRMKNSSIKAFLSTPNEWGWDVKRKLVWLGTQSFLFRDDYLKFIGDEKAPGIEKTDNFICEATTRWSGLGAVDILVNVIDITPSQRNELWNWYEKHAAIYKILNVTDEFHYAENIISRENYVIRTNEIIYNMPAGTFVYGGLVPWNDEWYWSGAQINLGRSLDQEHLQKMKLELQRKSTVTYRYLKNLLQEAIEHTENYYNAFVDYFGDDLVVFPDGQTMQSALQDFSVKRFENISREERAEMQKKYGAQNPWGGFNLSQNLLKRQDGIAVYFERSEGIQMMTFFNDIQSGLEKKGEFLDADELAAIRGFITSINTSPDFVKKVIKGQAIRSVRQAFLIQHGSDDLLMSFLFRCYKGHYFRNYYPGMSII